MSSRSDKMVNILFIVTVNSGMWTAVVAALSLASVGRHSSESPEHPHTFFVVREDE